LTITRRQPSRRLISAASFWLSWPASAMTVQMVGQSGARPAGPPIRHAGRLDPAGDQQAQRVDHDMLEIEIGG
jgi:hypothetical protein